MTLSIRDLLGDHIVVALSLRRLSEKGVPPYKEENLTRQTNFYYGMQERQESL